MTHDFRPGDVVEWTRPHHYGSGGFVRVRAVVTRVDDAGTVHVDFPQVDLRGVALTLVSRGLPSEGDPKLCRECYGLGGDEVRGGPGQCERCKRHGKPAITIQRPGEWSAGNTPTEHPSRARAASSLRAASASLTTAIDHLTRAGEAETYPGQTVIRIRTASEETQACIQHATMAMYWLLHERLGA